mmetsp:Transcript_19901/g.50287  ORF Transcript_19901/g.50287 Transcript_19901/m.50287 type:complete len:214 (+) Transcript_19901:52-693(+)
MAGVLNLTGAWELDKERSQSMYPHMKLLGCDEIAALASEKLNLKLHIIQSADRISVWQQSQLGIVYRALSIGNDTIEHSSLGERKVWVAVNPDEIIVDTKFKNGRLLDTRTVHLDPETGDQVLCTVLQLTMRGHGGSAKTTRYFRRTGDVDPEIVNTPPENIATFAGLPLERPNVPGGVAAPVHEVEESEAVAAAAAPLAAQPTQPAAMENSA